MHTSSPPTGHPAPRHRAPATLGLALALGLAAAPVAGAETPSPSPTPGAPVAASSESPSPVGPGSAAPSSPASSATATAAPPAATEPAGASPTAPASSTGTARASSGPATSPSASSSTVPAAVSTTASSTPTPSTPAASTPAAAAATGLPTITVPPQVGVCLPLTVQGTAAPKAAVVVDFKRTSSWQPAVARATADAAGRWSATVREAECYPGTQQVGVRTGAAASASPAPAPTAVATTSRTGARPSYTIALSQPSHTSPGLYRAWGPIRATGTVSVPTSTSISLWQLSADGRTARKLATTTSSTTGSYSFSTPFPATDGSSLFVDSGLGAGAQRSARATVTATRPSLSLTIPASLDATTTGWATGSPGPRNVGNRRLLVQVLRGRSWVQVVSGAATNGAYRLPFTDFVYRATPGTYQVRATLLQPDGSWLVSPTRTIKRTAGLNAVVRATTAADVAKSYRAGCPVGPASLRTVEMNYLGYDGVMHRGVLIVRKDLADNVVAAFTRGTTTGLFPIKSMNNPNVYGGDDVTMMKAGNTSAFNCRRVTGNPYAMSPHSYGKAIDVNTIENPYRDPQGRWYPSTKYATHRPASVKGLLVASSGLTVGLKAQSYAWFSGWDWQHFEAK